MDSSFFTLNSSLTIMSNPKQTIQSGRAVLGIEFGSTRIKAVLIDENNAPIAQGAHEWENRYEDRLWTYSIEDIWTVFRTATPTFARMSRSSMTRKLLRSQPSALVL